MLEFQHYLPVNLVFGRGKSETIGRTAAALGNRALVVTGGSSTKRSGLLDSALRQLSEAGVGAVLFDRVTPNPLTTTAVEGAEIAVREGCDVVVALGGGSSLDAAKGIAFQAANGGDISDYIFARKTSAKALPVVAVPTTCGTGSEGNGFAVLTNPETLDKKSLRCNAIIPACSIVDPLLMKTMPRDLLATVGFDALSHNLEAFLSAICRPLTAMHALEGFRLAAENVLRAVENPDDDEALDALCLASTLGGMSIHLAGVTAVHGMEHPASGLRDIVHAKGLAALSPVVYERSIAGMPEKFATLSRILGGTGAGDFVERLRALLRALGLELTLGDLGLKPEDADWMADNCMRISAAGIANHPVVFDREAVRELYLAAM